MAFYKVNYNSTKTGAIQINGLAGSGIAVIDSVLLNGFNSKSVTNLSRTDTTATVTTSTDHGFVIDDIVGFYGVVEAGWNGLYKIVSVLTTTSFTFTVPDTLSTSTTGTITVKYPPTGSYLSSGNLVTYWTKVLSGTNKAIYRSLDPQCTQWYLRVDDTNTRYMAVSILEGYSTIDTGLVNRQDVYWGKSYTADSVTRPWQFISDSKRFYFSSLWTNYATTITRDSQDFYFFGDILTNKPGDIYHCAIIGNVTTVPMVSVASDQGSKNYNSFTVTDTTTTGAYILRKYDQLGTQQPFRKMSTITYTNNLGNLSGNITHPNPANAGTYVDQQVFLVENNSFRGKMPGFHPPLNNTLDNFVNRDTSVVINNKQFMYFRCGSYQYTGGFWIDITPDVPWSL